MSWYQALRLSPFFLLGLAANRFHDLFRKPQVLWTCAFAFVITMGFHVYHMVMWSGVAQRGSVLDLLVGATGTLALLGFFPSAPYLGRLGMYSFAVYLFHPFLLPLRARCSILYVTADEIVFSVSAGGPGPVILERIVAEFPWPEQPAGAAMTFCCSARRTDPAHYVVANSGYVAATAAEIDSSVYSSELRTVN
jgi:hypothetical protein